LRERCTRHAGQIIQQQDRATERDGTPRGSKNPRRDALYLPDIIYYYVNSRQRIALGWAANRLSTHACEHAFGGVFLRSFVRDAGRVLLGTMVTSRPGL